MNNNITCITETRVTLFLTNFYKIYFICADNNIDDECFKSGLDIQILKELIQFVRLRLKFCKFFVQDIENILNYSQCFEFQSIESAPLSDRTSDIINSQPSESEQREIVLELDQSQDGVVLN